MIRPVAAVALALLITAGLAVHLAARSIVDLGYGPHAIIAMMIALPLLSRYLD